MHDMRGARFENVDLTGAVFREAMLVNVRMSGLISGLVINDIEVAPLIRAEMCRRHPELEKLTPITADGVREAWALLEQMWAETIIRVRSLPEPLLHERVDGEWSFLETLRHLVMVIDAWISGRVLGKTDQFHPIGVAPSFIDDPTAMGLDVHADPALDEVLAVREGRNEIVRNLIADLTDAELDRSCAEETLRQCLWTLFDEEWSHHRYATRDLEVLIVRGS